MTMKLKVSRFRTHPRPLSVPALAAAVGSDMALEPENDGFGETRFPTAQGTARSPAPAASPAPADAPASTRPAARMGMSWARSRSTRSSARG